MAKIMGVPTVVCGLRPGVVASLVLLGADTDEIRAARDLDMAFRLLNASVKRTEEGEGGGEKVASNQCS